MMLLNKFNFLENNTSEEKWLINKVFDKIKKKYFIRLCPEMWGDSNHSWELHSWTYFLFFARVLFSFVPLISVTTTG